MSWVYPHEPEEHKPFLRFDYQGKVLLRLEKTDWMIILVALLGYERLDSSQDLATLRAGVEDLLKAHDLIIGADVLNEHT